LKWTFAELIGNKKDKLIIGRDLLRHLGFLTDESFHISLPMNKEEQQAEAEDDDLNEDEIFHAVEAVDVSDNHAVSV